MIQPDRKQILEVPLRCSELCVHYYHLQVRTVMHLVVSVCLSDLFGGHFRGVKRPPWRFHCGLLPVCNRELHGNVDIIIIIIIINYFNVRSKADK